MATDPKWEDPIVDALPVPVEPVVPAGIKPRLWTVFVAYLLVLAAIIGTQIVLGIALFIWYTAHGWSVQRLQQELPALLSTPLNVILIGSVTQLIVGLGALLAAWFSPRPLRYRLGLTRPLLTHSLVSIEKEAARPNARSLDCFVIRDVQVVRHSPC
jgi:hypothetical protein